MPACHGVDVPWFDNTWRLTNRKVNAMNHIVKFLAAMFLSTLAIPELSAAPGTPIGGIIVKGGKNPGGQMLVRTTTDTSGKFTLRFDAGGEYQLIFDQAQARKDFGEKVQTGLQVDYFVQTPAHPERRASFHKNVERGAIIVTIPAGGGTITGTVRSVERLQAPKPAAKGITQSGIK